MFKISASIFLIVQGFLLAQADFRSEALIATNNFRAKHQSPPLTQDETINGVAQAYADKLASENKFEHSGNEAYGENLYASWGARFNATKAAIDAVKAWYAEIKHYDYENPGFSMKTGHFTQVVWKNSKSQGIGVAYNDKTKFTVVVANYDLPGNYEGEFPENVLPPISS